MSNPSPESDTAKRASAKKGPEDVKSPTFYWSLAHTALAAGHEELAARYKQYAEDLYGSPEGKKALIKQRVDETILKVQQLTAWGADEVVRGRSPDDTTFWHVVDEVKGAELYTGVSKDIAGPVLAQVYQQLGVTQERLAAIPSRVKLSGVPQELRAPSADAIPASVLTTYHFNTPWGISLTEEQTHYEDGSVFYCLSGQNTEIS